MRRFIIRLAAATCLLTVGVGAAEAAVCVSIDEARDTLSPHERAATLIVVSKQFEQAGEQVVPVGCPTQYSLSHVRLGDTIIVTLTGPNGSREATATGLDDLPALYNQMVRSILTRRPMSGFNVVDRTNVPKHKPRRGAFILIRSGMRGWVIAASSATAPTACRRWDLGIARSSTRLRSTCRFSTCSSVHQTATIRASTRLHRRS